MTAEALSENQASAEATQVILPQQRVYEIGGIPLHVRETGVGRRQKLILIHGWSSSWYALSPLLPMLSERYHCIAVDLPGYGATPRLPQRTTIPAYADLIAGLIEQVAPDQAVPLIGHSMGGMTSLTLALKRPELVERLVLICPTISGKLSTRIALSIAPITFLERYALTGKLIGLVEPWLLNITDRLMRPISFADRSEIGQRDYEQLRADARRPGQGQVRAECYAAMKDNDLRGRLKGLTVPTLAIWGMEDNTVPLRDASAFDLELPEQNLQVLPNAGHWPQFETPKVTQKHIRAFMSTPIKLFKVQF